MVLHANALAEALSPAHRPGVNAYISLFRDPALRALYGEGWGRVADEVVAGLHAARGDRAAGVVEELLGEAPDFAARWARYEVRPRRGGGVTRLRHPDVGPIALRFEKLAATEDPRVGVVLFSAGPEPEDARALERLAAAVAAGGAGVG